MQPLTLQLRHEDEQAIECWDDDGELQCYEDNQFHTVSRATSVTNSSIRRSGHRDSISSRRSARSDLDSNAADDEDWRVQLHENDELANEDAIASARSAGIPLPANVPKSALVGGTIKRLGRKKPKRDFMDDWEDDLELPNPDGVLELKQPLESVFPESLGQISSAATSPVKPCSPVQDGDLSPWQSTLTNLSGFQHEGDDFDLQDVPTIKIAKLRSGQRAISTGETTPTKAEEVEEFDQDFELPAEGVPLQLPPRAASRKTPSPPPEDFDVDWCEGSIGIRFGGTSRDRPSNASSSISVVSPSVSSCLSGASDDDGLDGLVIPEGPLALDATVNNRRDSISGDTSTHSVKAQASRESASSEDFLLGIEIEGDDAFTGAKRSLNPNIKCRTERPWSPARRSETSLTFTNSTGSPKTRIPRPSSHLHAHSTHLETVSESGASPSKSGHLQSHLGDSSLNSSIPRLPFSTPASAATRLTLNRRLVGTLATKARAADDPFGHTSSHPLKSKRSMPAMRNSHHVTSPGLPQYSPACNDGTGRLSSTPTIRSFAPVDRTGNNMKSLNRRRPAPFIPAGAPGNQSHHVSVKSYRHNGRSNPDSTGPVFNAQGSMSRAGRMNRNEPIGKNSNEQSPEQVVSTTKRTITRPSCRQKFGDGSELELFDDLPTSTWTESRFVKDPAGRGIPRALRSRLGQSQGMQRPVDTPNEPQTSVNVSKPSDFTPRFARDTNASRNAREQRIASVTTKSKIREGNPLMSLSTNPKTQTAPRCHSHSTLVRNRRGKSSTSPGSKPHLIKPIGTGVQEAKCELSLGFLVMFREANCIYCSCEWNALQSCDLPLGGE